MKIPFRTSVAFAVLSVSALAQPAPKILVVAMDKLYDTHYKTEEQNAKLKVDQAKAEEELQKLNASGTVLVDQYKELVEQAKNPAITNEARGKAEAAAQAKGEEIQKKQNEVGSFRENTARFFQQRIKTFRDLMLEEIGKVATEIAKKKGATLLIDKAGPSMFGVSNILYFDPAYDITDEVMKEVNKDRPAPAAGAVPTTAPATPPPASKAPSITVPGAPAKK